MRSLLRRVKRKIFGGSYVRPAPVVRPWDAEKGDLTYRLNYPSLTSGSIVFDLGGYEGQWASDIYASYPGCKLFIFEPVQAQAQFIKNRFKKNKDVSVFQLALGDKSGAMELSLDNNCSSSFVHAEGAATESVEVISFQEFVKSNKVDHVDLLKINIEGGEFDLLKHLIETGLIKKINSIQVQFHDFFPNAIELRREIREQLSITHKEDWNFEFIWEGWSLKD